MSDLVVITFTTQDAGLAALKHVRDVGACDRADVCPTPRSSRRTPTARSTSRTRSAAGPRSARSAAGLLGLLLGVVFFPVLGIAIGAAIGAAIGHSVSSHVDQDFVKDIQAELTPGTSALFAVVKANPSALVAAVRGFDGKVYQTTLEPGARGVAQRGAQERRLTPALRRRPSRPAKVVFRHDP